jgi:20S proteasome subunit beta 5
MNSLAQRFSNNGPLAQIGKATSLVSEDDEFSDAAWGSEAGFGSVAKGIPTFTVPNVPDVRYRRV